MEKLINFMEYVYFNKELLMNELMSETDEELYDIGYFSRRNINISEIKSCNYDFMIKTYQTRMENIYVDVIMYDYVTEETVNLGYFYLKNFTGKFILKRDFKMIQFVISAFNNITDDIWENQNNKDYIWKKYKAKELWKKYKAKE